MDVAGSKLAYPVGLLKRAQNSDTPNKRKQKEDDSGEFDVQGDVGSTINEQIRRAKDLNTENLIQGPLDPIFGQRRAFPIALDLESVDASKATTDVNSYLALVRLEAQQFERKGFRFEASVAKKRILNSNNQQAHSEATLDKGKHRRWPVDYLEEFKSIKKSYLNYRLNLTELDAIDLPQNQKEWKYLIFNNEPSFGITAQIVEENVNIKLIVYFTKWLNRDINVCFEQWIFHMLYATDTVMTSSNMSVMRALGKKALKQMAAALDKRNQAIMERIVLIIGVIYGQRDLLNY
ncbi:hypothetical protein KL918_005029 [Ogataea parapolymorpha]|uniref:Uncharacterized protein n=1 Tax=Ogataea parapolymorpha (strain ATCC 26012 / BCRC 20466 / JCM 22074 / NRRL Y-7560 / DL-1) TaxID=871575 RepID=W1QJC8_OGAPD|nr:hypothetical protein HPODL_04743 [Ogataea parapolymorpha DL-1]ESX01978.1 hypothetical protein HPODL_04743 [Ogataea parapolymorpha DL-1]KAG7864903.1 hypothetical protein KL918_005029 [Ogataea parapolymorpha]KAG7871595.1 hypothetical protein KL916_003946 [Ogataea parapolymorpha]